MGKKLKGKDLIKIGFPQNNSVNIALGQISRYRKRVKKEKVLAELKEVLRHPEKYTSDGTWGKVTEAIVKPVEVRFHHLLHHRAPYSIYGEDAIDDLAKQQLYDALKLPVARAGALMPDAHAGYGLPIGGVLACENAVIPYGVGVDIGCRMALSILPMEVAYLDGHRSQLENILKNHTKFGMSETHKIKNDHEVFSNRLFDEIPLLKQLKSKAYKQLGTSGGGNHFVEFGIIDIPDEENEWSLPVGKYVGLLSHSGSRGLGANIARHYTYLARRQCPLPQNVQHLAWLDMDTHDGQEYWLAMNLAGDYAKACHDDIHRRICKILNVRPIATVENHHNFAWKEVHNGNEYIVHRKGATPADEGRLGFIPGSMTAPGYIVRGRGIVESLNSASHGAGRKLSRRKSKESFTKSQINKELKAHNVSLIGGGIDEAPMAYKDINDVMNAQQDLVDIVAQFTPQIVRMDY